MHARTRAHTQIHNTAFPRQQWFRECASMIRYKYIVCLVWSCMADRITSEDGTHSGFRNVVSKFTSHTVQKPQNQKTTTLTYVWTRFCLRFRLWKEVLIHQRLKIMHVDRNVTHAPVFPYGYMRIQMNAYRRTCMAAFALAYTQYRRAVLRAYVPSVGNSRIPIRDFVELQSWVFVAKVIQGPQLVCTSDR